MKVIKKMVGKNALMQAVDDTITTQSTPNDVITSWYNKISFIEEDTSTSQRGLRAPQIGALFALLSHWTTTTEPATVVMPTGTGKTETMICAIISKRCEKVLVLVPSDLLRNQITDKCLTFGLLKELGVVHYNAINPVVALLKNTPESIGNLNSVIEASNIVVSTISLVNRFPDAYKERMIEAFSHLFIDEAHHVEAASWKAFKSTFTDKAIVQFTATPFRNDGKKVDGKIIYNYPLAKAQDDGYFRPINFIPIFEFDDQQSDFAIAEKAIQQLRCDLDNGYSHVVLVRSYRKSRAERLYNEIYKDLYDEYNPVLVHSGMTKSEKNKAINDVKNGSSKILVCVDMFGEGIDIPQLKIAAIHDRYKSLAITIQFIGRFARSQAGLGEASVIANIADDNVNGAIKELYSEDADWNKLLRSISSDAIGKEISLQQLAQGFSGTSFKDIKIEQLLPKMSMVAFKTSDEDWKVEGWHNVFNEDACIFKINEEEKVAVIIERVERKIEWSRLKEINNITWELHLVYWNKEKHVLFVNSTNKTIHRKLAESILTGSRIISGEQTFRCLYGINRLMLSTVGLNSKIDGPIRYKMFAGIDVAAGISEAQKANNEKSNLFGVGYNGQGPVSIGCSYKGRIWSRWVESLAFWCNWCNEVAEKLLDDQIKVEDVLKGVLIPKIVKERPNVMPCAVEWPIDFQLETEEKAMIVLPLGEYHAREVDISLASFDETSPLKFTISNENFLATFELCFDAETNTARYVCLDNPDIEIKIGQKQEKMVEYFQENGPLFRFVDQSVLETNYYTKLKHNEFIRIDEEDIIAWDWDGVDIKKESQGRYKETNSIQYRTISNLKHGDYDIIFDDDSSGEIADIITIKSKEDKIEFEFYHCKFSSSDKPGSRVDDLYVVCGQAQKSIIWKQNGIALVERMLARERTRIANTGVSRFEQGNVRKLVEIKNKLKKFPSELKIYVVQPGVNSCAISDPMHQVLGSTKAYLLDTYGLKFIMICS